MIGSRVTSISSQLRNQKTSVTTGIELQYVTEDEWDCDRVVRAHQEIASQNMNWYR